MKRVALWILAVFMATTAVPLTALAEDGVSELTLKDFNSANGVEFYDETAPDCSPTGTASSGSAGRVSSAEKDRVELVLRYLTEQKGLTLVQATGFAGNMHAESGVNPAIIQGGATASSTYTPVAGVGFGLVQWTTGGRQKGLVTLSNTSPKRSITDMNLQLDYVWKEVTTSYKATLQALVSTKDLSPEQAAIIVHGRTPKVANDPRFSIAPRLGYEASNDTAEAVMANRAAYARNYYEAFKGSIQDGKGISGGVSSSLTTSSSGACGSTGADATCTATAPIYGESGNGHQLTKEELISLYGPGGESAKSKMTTVDFLGESVTVHQKVAGCLRAVAKEMETNNIKYNVKVIGGFRTVKGQGQVAYDAGYHWYGVAIDINPDQNGYYEGGGDYPHDIPPAMVIAFRHHGWSWGGNWKSIKDYMHFEYNGTKVP